MVSTRRSTANAKRLIAGTKKPKVAKPASDTIHVKEPRRKKAKTAVEIPKSSSIPLSTVFSISDHDIDHPSPITLHPSTATTTNTAETKNLSPNPPHQPLSSALRKLTPKPFASMSGSCHDPIVVNEGSSPPRPTICEPKRKNRDEKTSESHRFIGNRRKDLYSHGARRSGLTNAPFNKSTRNNHQSHDIYRRMNTRTVSAPHSNLNAFPVHGPFDVPFLMQHALPTQTFAYQQIRPSFPVSYAPYHQFPPPMIPNLVITPQSEETLRRKVVEYVRDFPKTSVQSNVNPHHLIEHTLLLTSLLQIYPHSKNQQGLCEDIRTMLALQSHNMTAWLGSESQNMPRQKESSSGNSYINTQPKPLPSVSLNEEDREVRRAFSASAGMWQDGTENGVADVFGTRSTSSPVASPRAKPN
ncbi:hypothetical protein COCC4DRAFT_64233 [Bipolaris maydis ATCC 48331]|uniref:Uncharacterized protein n=2 Tax=Cochliobolus heterostrophus TaxID=5016 RepID=M2U8J7_COCH5|nr:uncharacterized protein COCC4DRAFT_64233 [Bipolaris maydis ATCC 48331]EMD94859.1 hypothetical protein COCHEDRAFT_1191647 [Bipolaris maydis C5]KAJ5029261.1 hypothetical protein J3E73DRAFT_379167 [Bipolaris maydis]ENI01849.1 hypothetical protein COCC4DRAFT_64233 [Bipolaris maydis ATCC 48331]KAJ5062002.1 hypothetical protein J3E74DRAFT_268053 [Bipolaris maydis]KAJ6192663.1 hypothetical protein J3E72DRAFT_253485 [Bipolaris maydis]